MLTDGYNNELKAAQIRGHFFVLWARHAAYYPAYYLGYIHTCIHASPITVDLCVSRDDNMMPESFAHQLIEVTQHAAAIIYSHCAIAESF